MELGEHKTRLEGHDVEHVEYGSVYGCSVGRDTYIQAINNYKN